MPLKRLFLYDSKELKKCRKTYRNERIDLFLWKAGLSQCYCAHSIGIFPGTHALEYLDMRCHLQSDYEKDKKMNTNDSMLVMNMLLCAWLVKNNFFFPRRDRTHRKSHQKGILLYYSLSHLLSFLQPPFENSRVKKRLAWHVLLAALGLLWKNTVYSCFFPQAVGCQLPVCWANWFHGANIFPFHTHKSSTQGY